MAWGSPRSAPIAYQKNASSMRPLAENRWPMVRMRSWQRSLLSLAVQFMWNTASPIHGDAKW